MSNNASSPNRWPVLFLLLMAVGVPSAAGVAFAEQVTQNPSKALGLALLYELLVLILGFIFKVWQKLESRWVDRAADWVDRKVQSVFSRYRRRYLEHLVYRHGVFDVKGLATQGIYPLELEQVFVELSVAPQVLHGVSADPIRQIPEELRGGRHVIWDYLQSEKMAGQNLAVIGPPGCGKTTLLQHMTLTLAAGRKHRRQVNAPEKLPILLFLRNHAEAIQDNPDLSLVQAVQNNLTRWNAQAPAGWFEAQLEKGRCLVMFDGLDEVADLDARKHVVSWVERQMVAYAKNRFVITSRPHGYQTNPLSRVTVLEARPFTSEQVRSFVHNWYMANEVMSAQKDDPGARMAAKEGAEDLLRRIRSTPALSDMAVNPLLLTMITTVHRYRSTLPKRRVELYAEICDVFLGARQQARDLALELTPTQKQRVLQPLAYHMMCQKKWKTSLDEAVKVVAEPLARVKREVSGEDFLRMIENTSGVLLERESGMYSFAHHTFQEYLTAVHVQKNKLENALVGRVEDSWWHEAICLYVAQTDATPIIAACLVKDPPPVPALTLAIECQEEAMEVQPDLKERLKSVLDQGVEDPDSQRRQIVAEALLALRLRRMVRVDEDKYVDNSLITHTEYQLFLDEQRAFGKYHQPDHWLSSQFPPGQGCAPVVGVRPSDAGAFCEWLTEREAGDWRYRLPMRGEFDSIPLGDKGQEAPQAGLGYWAVTDEVAECVRTIKSGSIIPDEMLSQWIAYDLALTHAFGHALNLAHAFDCARNRAHALDRVLDLDRDRNLDCALDVDRDFIRDFDRAPALVSIHVDVRIVTPALALPVDLDQTPALDLALALDSALDSALNRALALDRAQTSASWEEKSGSLHWTVRIRSLWLAATFQRQFRSWTRRMGLRKSLSEEDIWHLVDGCFSLYLDFAILEERIQGNLPAFEGIRIVKERKREETEEET